VEVLRIVIVDDELDARQRVKAVVQRIPGSQIVGECQNGSEALSMIRAERPDLVLLDMQMPGLSGLEVVKALGADGLPLVVFITAFEEYAVRAFEACAMDYVLKPFEDDRLIAAVERARRQVKHLRDDAPVSDPRMQALLEYLANPRGHAPSSIAVRSGRRFVVIQVQDIDWAAADGNDCVLHVAGRPHVLSRTLGELERTVLASPGFVRIHRSTIVNIAKVSALEPVGADELWVVLTDGARLSVSRAHRAELRARLHITH
jgi:two-component system LytT family response regulator